MHCQRTSTSYWGISVTIAVLPGGSGFGVDTRVLEQAATEAISLADTFGTLTSAIDADLQTAAQIGLGVGLALQSAIPQWDTLLKYFSSQVSAAGSNLSTNAAAYGDSDARTTAAFSRIAG
jgi:hypothetical protein